MKKNVIIGIVSLVIGSVASYLYCKKRFEEGCCEVEGSCDEQCIVESEDKSSPAETSVLERGIKDYSVKSFKNDEASDSPQRIYNNVVKNLYRKDSEEPYAITESQFVDEDEDYDKITVLYYDNGVITDDSYDVMDDIDTVIGLNNLSCFGYGSSDKDVLYVRNDKLKIDYEILRQNADYKTDV